MWAPLYLLVFIRFIIASTADIDPLTQIAQAFFKEDFFYTHLKSEFVNASISPCDNFYRHLCPKDFPDKSWIMNKLVAQIKAIMNINDFLSPAPEDHTMQRILSTAALDSTDYLDERSIGSAISRLRSFGALKDCLGTEEFSKASGKYFHLLPQALLKDRPTISKAFAIKIQEFISYISQQLLPMLTKFEDTILVEKTIRMLVQRDGMAYETARERIESIISNIIEEYLLQVRGASWSSKEDRFGQTRGHIVTKYIRNVSYAISFANRYSIPENTKDYIADNYRNLFLAEHQLLSDLSHMPLYRNACAKFKAFSAVYQKLTGAHKPQVTTHDGQVFVGFSNAEMGVEGDRYAASIVMNHVFSTHAALSAHEASLLGFTGFMFAHEMYHQLQFAFQGNVLTTGYIEDFSDLRSSEQCVIDHFARVCNRFNEKACASAHTVTEDAPDVFGIQILFAVAQKLLGNDIDKIVFPDLGMTNRELLYYTTGVSICTADFYSQWRFKPAAATGKGDVHNGVMYRVNGLLAQLPDFKRTFGCYDDDRMVFPEGSMCPAL